MFCFSVRITHARNRLQHSPASQIPRWNNSSTRKWMCFGKGSRVGRTNADRYRLSCFRRPLGPYIDASSARRIDPGHLFGKETQKVVVPGVCWRRRRAMGTMVSRTPRSSFGLDSSMSTTQQDRQRRTETAEIRSRYTFTYPSHFIRAYMPFARGHHHMVRNSFTSSTHRSPRIQRHPRRHPHQSPPGHAHPYFV